MKKVMISRPRAVGGDATNYTFFWADPVIEKARQNGYNVYDFKRNAASYKNITKALRNVNPDMYIHFGHGCPNSLIGQRTCIVTNSMEKDKNMTPGDVNCNIFCDFNSNVGLLKDKIVIAYACHSASKLGICAMRYGARAYIGFDDYLIFLVDSKHSEQLFVTPLTMFVESLLDGDTIYEAKMRTLAMYDEYIKEYKNVRYLARLLMWDKIGFTVYGDDNIKLTY